MGTFTALVLATPIFGFALSPPAFTELAASSEAAYVASAAPAAVEAASAAPVAVAALGGLPVAAQLDASLSFEGEAEATGPTVASASSSSSGNDYVKLLRKRARMAKVHRTLGIATWAMTAFSVISGTIQYRNLYGAPFVTELQDTPCVQGNAWISQNQCSGAPWFHAITGFTTGGLYVTTLALAIAMPDPDDASKGDSQYAKTLRTHKILRWVHVAGMVTQTVLGIVMANPRLGLDRANDYDTLKVLSGIHLASGYVTLGALTWAGTIMLF
jgi:hypothetical protein